MLGLSLPKYKRWHFLVGEGTKGGAEEGTNSAELRLGGALSDGPDFSTYAALVSVTCQRLKEATETSSQAFPFSSKQGDP